MFTPDDNQDDTIFDQLRSIRPFTVDQLYLIHPDVGCPPKAAISSEETDANNDHKFVIPQPDNELYQNLVEYEQLKNQLYKLKHDIKKQYKNTHDHVDKAWSLKEESIRRVAMCQQGKIAETTFKYNKASIDKKHLSMFSQEFSGLIDLITRDYIYYSFESQVKRNKISTRLSIAYQLPDLEERKSKLKSSIVTLFEFLRYLSDNKPDFVILCRKWLRALCKRYLESGTTMDYRFIMSQLAKSPVGAADWSADLVECKPYEQVSGFDSVPQYITHCSAILSELFYSLQLRIKQITATAASTDNNAEEIKSNSEKHTQAVADQNWSLVDPRFNCTEELNMTSSICNLLSESDVIKFCLRIPIAQIFRAHVKNCLEITTESHMNKNYEFIMLKLLTIGTVIIKTYQIGLETFNSIQYGSLIEYLSSQIRRTVVILSDQWSEFKQRLRGIDDALLMRLQVEYDNFMLRSILIILELRQSGIWRHLSRVDRDVEMPNYDNPLSWSTDSLRPAFAKLLQVTGISPQSQQASETVEKGSELIDNTKKPSRMLQKSSSLTYEFSTEWFKDVSEPMLWHILWQFYHNAFVSSCDYHSDYHWLKKFQEKSVIYLFVNKIKDSPPGECSYLLNSITSMLLSRTNPESKLVNFIATEMFNLTFKNQSVKEKVSRKGVICLVRSAEKFPNLISLYLSLMHEDIDGNAVDLMKSCSLKGWICNESELTLLESWLIEHPLSAPKNKIARLIICKLLLNSPHSQKTDDKIVGQTPKSLSRKNSRRLSCQSDCFLDISMRRKLALVLYHASTAHLPENNQFGPQSLGASVEVAFGAGLFGNPRETMQDNLLDLATDSTYQQFYIWTWRILFALKLHILNQAETDWNDVQIRSGTSRSTKNTVLVDDRFYPVPSIEDSECSLLAHGVKSQNPIASFIYLLLTDVTWHSGTVDSCLSNLNVLAESGHITPSLMAMKFFTICHLDDLTSHLVEDKRCIEYFKKVIFSNFDATRLASLIMTQLDHLKQYRQLQLSHFYIKVFLDISTIITKQTSASWFSNNEINLEKIACLLDFIVRFNFANQRFELIRKFYSASMVHDQQLQNSSWLASFMTSNIPQRDFSTNLHVLAKKFRKYHWLQWVTNECDALRLEKVWEDIVAYLSTNEEATLDSAIKKVCPHANATLLRSTLPIYSWIGQIFDIMESDLNHPLCPLVWYNFFLNYFANSLNGVSVGVKLVSQETLARLMTRLDSLYNYHLYKQRNWSSSSALQQNTLTQLYKAYKLWLQDPSLRDAYVDIDRLKDDYLVPLLKAVMESSNATACLQYVDLDSIETQNKNLIQVWSSSARSSLNGNHLTDDPIIYVDKDDLEEAPADRSMGAEDELADDAVSLIIRSHKTVPEGKATRSLDDGHEELGKQLDDELSSEKPYRTTDELIIDVKESFGVVFEESTLFELNISELNRTKTEIIELVSRLYTNKKREFVRVVPCIEGNECIGPARIKFEAVEALMDERKNQCIQDRRRQCQELVGELLLMPKNGSVKASMLIEDNVKRLIEDSVKSKLVIETLLAWLSEPANYTHLSGDFYTANYLLMKVLEILSTTDQVDTYNYSLINVCLAHPESVQMLSPYLSPTNCSAQCFLDTYKTICSRQAILSPMATFVLLSKFDIRSWLNANSVEFKRGYHDLIVTTCSAFKHFGKEPDKSYELTMDLFKRHLQIELSSPIRNKPDELLLVLEQFLNLMDEQLLAPSLWLDFLSIIGLNYDSSKDTNITENVARLAASQTIFDHQSLCFSVRRIKEFFNERSKSRGVISLDFYQDYIEQYGIVALSITFMWIKSTSDEMLVDNYDRIWEQFLGIWVEWVFPLASCNIKSNYNLMVNCFVFSLQYMIHKMPDCVQPILSSLLSEMTSYVGKLKDNLNMELTILQRCLKGLPWSSMLATMRNIVNLETLSDHTSHNLSDLVSHIMLQLNINKSIERMYQESGEFNDLGLYVERLSNIITSKCHQLQHIQLPRNYLSAISTDRIPRLLDFMQIQADFLYNDGDKLLFKLLKYICLGSRDIKTGPNGIQKDYDSVNTTKHTVDQIERAVFYARFVSDYLANLIKRYPANVHSPNTKPLVTVINNSLLDLEPIIHSRHLSADQRKILYADLLKCCECDILDINMRLLLARLFVESSSMKNKPEVVVDMLQSIGQFLRDPKILVNMVEMLVDSYYSLRGDYEDVCKSFCLSPLQAELYLDSCINEMSPMALMIYYESEIFRQSNQPSIDSLGTISDLSSAMPSLASTPDRAEQLWPSYLFWLSRLIHQLSDRSSGTQVDSVSAHKITTILIRLLMNMEQTFAFSENEGDPGVSPFNHVESTKSFSGDDLSPLEQNQNQNDPCNVANNSAAALAAASTQKSNLNPSMSSLLNDHKCLLGFIKQLISFYDSINSGGLWSYLKLSNKSEQSVKVSVTSLAVACFLADRTLIYLNKCAPPPPSSSSSSAVAATATVNQSDNPKPAHLEALREELTRLRRICLAKLETARKLKSSIDCSQFIDSFTESAQPNSRVQYGDVVQLITMFVKTSREAV
jgi:hypothetical protein